MSGTNTVSPLRQRMLEDMAARKLNPHTQRSHISSCKRFAAWLKRSPDAATPDEVRRFQLHLIESGASICNRNRIMTGIRFLFRVTLRRHDLAAEVWHIKEPQKLPPVLSSDEVKRVLTLATSLKARAMLTLAYGCGLRASEVVRLRAGDIDSEQMIIRATSCLGAFRTPPATAHGQIVNPGVRKPAQQQTSSFDIFSLFLSLRPTA
jgi:site-specific recombinase XerD